MNTLPYRYIQGSFIRAKLRLKAEQISRDGLGFVGLGNKVVPLGTIEQWTEETSRDLESILSGDRRLCAFFAKLFIGTIVSRLTGLTPQISQLAQIESYCTYNGKLQEFFALLDIEHGDRLYDLTLLGREGLEMICSQYNELQQTGYTVWQDFVDTSFLKLVSDTLDSLNTAWRVTYTNESVRYVSSRADISNPHNGDAVKAAATLPIDSDIGNVLCKNKAFQLLADTYIGAPGKISSLQYWETYPSKTGVSEAAQMFHYDLDTFKWVKVLIFLNDVNLGNGPHEAVLGTHHSESNCNHLKQGYSRISDSDVYSIPDVQARKFCGLAGSAIICDTKAIHKGNQVISGNRNIIEVLYTSNTFGSVVPK